jgi:hypothetical protein
MAKFGLACEGITDQIVIENILCGFYKDIDDLDEEIQALQPPFDETTKKQSDYGSWELLLKYLSSKIFRDDVLNSEYIVIQIDTDDSQHPNFDVSPMDEHNQELSTETLIEKITGRLISQIDSKETFYEDNKNKIIFAISVHSLECWLLPLHETCKTERIKSCFEHLQRKSKTIKVQKDYGTYDKLSRPLLKNKTLLQTSSQNTSLQIFISNLPTLP